MLGCAPSKDLDKPAHLLGVCAGLSKDSQGLKVASGKKGRLMGMHKMCMLVIFSLDALVIIIRYISGGRVVLTLAILNKLRCHAHF